MGNHKFYIPNMPHKNRVSKKIPRRKESFSNDDYEPRKDSIEIVLKEALDYAKDDLELKEKILGELDTFRLNLTICRELHDKKNEKKLKKDFKRFLKHIRKEVKENV